MDRKDTKITTLLKKFNTKMFWGLLIMPWCGGIIYTWPTYHIICSICLTLIFLTAMYLMFSFIELKRDIIVEELMKDIDQEIKEKLYDVFEKSQK